MEDVKMVNLSFLTLSDMNKLSDKIGFTNDEKYILEHLVRDDMNDSGIMLNLGLSRNKYYDKKCNLIYKIIRYAAEK